MPPPTATDKKKFLATARINRASLIPLYFLHQERNEWVDWRGNTTAVGRMVDGPHYSLDDAKAVAEEKRTPGTVFIIETCIGVLLSCDGGTIVVWDRWGNQPYRGLINPIRVLSDRRSLRDVVNRVNNVVTLQSAIHLGAAVPPDVGSFGGDAPVYNRRSTAGGSRNGLAWSQTESPNNWKHVRRIVQLLNEDRAVQVTDAVSIPSGQAESLSLLAVSPALDVAGPVQAPSTLQHPVVAPPTLDGTQQATMRHARIGQDVFRASLFVRWKGCSVTGCRVESVLAASHIKPWAACETAKERLDVANGLLLIPNLDRLFDKGLISFDNEFRILLSSSLRPGDLSQLNVTPHMRLTSREHRDIRPYLAWHRARVFQA